MWKPSKSRLSYNCGNSEKAKSIIAYPRFKEGKAILIHTGTNDLKDIGMDTKSIADNLIQAANEAHENFHQQISSCLRYSHVGMNLI